MEQVPKFDEPAKPEKMKLNGHDQAVMATSNDALVTKVYASGLNYFVDPYSKLFIKNKRKMYPIINRGTWARVHAYRSIILRFLNAFKDSEKVNILSLGCGYDSTFFWLLECHPELSSKMCYIEIDYDQVVNKKIETINKHEELNQKIIENSNPTCDFEINSKNYKLFANDVRKIDEMG